MSELKEIFVGACCLYFNFDCKMLILGLLLAKKGNNQLLWLCFWSNSALLRKVSIKAFFSFVVVFWFFSFCDSSKAKRQIGVTLFECLSVRLSALLLTRAFRGTLFSVFLPEQHVRKLDVCGVQTSQCMTKGVFWHRKSINFSSIKFKI